MVDQAVGSAVRDVGLVEAVVEQRVRVVAQPQVQRGVLARGRAGALDVLVDDAGELGDQVRVGPDRRARPRVWSTEVK